MAMKMGSNVGIIIVVLVGVWMYPPKDYGTCNVVFYSRAING